MKSRFLTLLSLVLFIILTNIYGCATPGAVKYDPKSEIGTKQEGQVPVKYAPHLTLVK